MYRTHVKLRMSITVNHQVITASHIISRRWRQDDYHKLLSILPNLHPRVDGWVYVDGKQYYHLNAASRPSRLITSGNINEWRDNVYFNEHYIDFATNMDDVISIEVDGQWIDSGHLLNVTNNSPRVLTLPKPDGVDGICRLQLGYDAWYTVKDGIVRTHDGGLWVKSCNPTNAAYSQEQLDKFMLEWSIISE